MLVRSIRLLRALRRRCSLPTHLAHFCAVESDNGKVLADDNQRGDPLSAAVISRYSASYSSSRTLDVAGRMCFVR